MYHVKIIIWNVFELGRNLVKGDECLALARAVSQSEVVSRQLTRILQMCRLVSFSIKNNRRSYNIWHFSPFAYLYKLFLCYLNLEVLLHGPIIPQQKFIKLAVY